jgi:hypothetical protein
VWFWAQRSWASSVGPPRLGSTSWARSACGSAGRLGLTAWLRVVGRLGLTSRPTVYSPPSLSHWRHGPRGQRPSLSPTGGTRLSVTHRIWCGRQIRCSSSQYDPVCVCARVCVCGVPGGCWRKAPEGWLQRERDVAAASRGRRARRGCGGGMARLGRGRVSRHRCARTRAGPGFLGPRRGRAVRGAPASWARNTTRRRKATAARRGGAAGSCTRVAPRPEGIGGPKAGLRKVHRHRGEEGRGWRLRSPRARWRET